MICSQLKILSESYLDLKMLKKLRIYKNSILIKKLENHKENKKIKVVAMSQVDTERAIEALTNYMCYMQGEGTRFSLYDIETWGSELFLFNFILYVRTMI
jgi:hypothetical protein